MKQILRLGRDPIDKILSRTDATLDVSDVVRGIIADVIARGDDALYDYGERFDGCRLSALRVSEEEMADADLAVDGEMKRIMRRAADSIRSYHSRQLRSGYMIADEDGVILGQRVIPLSRVGIYVPGGRAAYPSTVLMDAIPAKLAGVGKIAMTTPPGRDGKVAPVILAAAAIAGVDEIYKVGGAQAVAALAYGTATIPRVDKIVGPGNAYVAEAKRQVYGRVGIDMVAGPSEILVIADGSAVAGHIAADLLSQAEHDKNASAVLLTDSESLAECVAAEVERRLSVLPREEIARASWENNGKIIVAGSIADAVAISNELAPEHLELCVRDPFGLLPSIQNAGSVFLGADCPEALGDYMAGPNHTLPTGGSARFSSALSVDDFVKKMQYTYYTRDALALKAADIAAFAESEGLSGHARSVTARCGE